MGAESSRCCPKCGVNQPLEQRQVGGPGGAGQVEIDVCPKCRGVWLDWGEVGELHELRAIIPSGSRGSSWERDLEKGGCASCAERHELQRIAVGAFGVDRCPDCLGLWFDGGELGPMLSDEGFDALLKALRTNPPG